MTAATKEKASTEAVIPVSREAVLAQWGDMLAAIPDADDDDGSGIIANVLMATTLEGLNTQGELAEADDFRDKLTIIRRISKRESTLEEGESPWYLIVEGELGDGNMTPFTYGTSSRTIMAQLVKAYVMGMLPIYATVKRGSKPTKRGFWPLALHIEGNA